jgi:GNAT superfamily N-acetyltransferase
MASTEQVEIRICTGKELDHYLEDLAHLRIEVFREFPYLYEGDMAYEKKYVRTLLESKESIIVLALDGGIVVGASTGTPLEVQPPEILEPWVLDKKDIEKIYYFSESVLQKEFRGKGIGLRFFEQRETWARQLGYEAVTFCAVIRPEDHPLRPEDYVPLDRFWQNRGFQKKKGFIGKIAWKEIQEVEETPKELQFWYKELIFD